MQIEGRTRSAKLHNSRAYIYTLARAYQNLVIGSPECVTPDERRPRLPKDMGSGGHFEARSVAVTGRDCSKQGYRP